MNKLLVSKKINRVMFTRAKVLWRKPMLSIPEPDLPNIPWIRHHILHNLWRMWYLHIFHNLWRMWCLVRGPKMMLMLVALVLVGAAAAQNNYPEWPDSCAGKQCARFLNAKCQLNPCRGLCCTIGNKLRPTCRLISTICRACLNVFPEF